MGREIFPAPTRIPPTTCLSQRPMESLVARKYATVDSTPAPARSKGFRGRTATKDFSEWCTVMRALERKVTEAGRALPVRRPLPTEVEMLSSILLEDGTSRRTARCAVQLISELCHAVGAGIAFRMFCCFAQYHGFVEDKLFCVLCALPSGSRKYAIISKL